MSAWLNDLYQALLAYFRPRPAPLPEPAPSPPFAPVPPITPAPAPPTTGSAVTAAINAARASRALPPLMDDDNLTRVALAWAGSMAESGVMDHGDFAGRMASVVPNTAAAENIAEGQPDATSVVAAWMDDPPHRANILGEYTRLGVGLARDPGATTYWCVDFARIDP